MCVENIKCHSWISLKNIGINAKGCLNDSSWLDSVIIPNIQSKVNPEIYIDLPDEKLILIRNVAHGKFGYIDLAQYQTAKENKYVYIKRPIISGKNLLFEACIQQKVHDSLTDIGFPTGAPKVLRIFRLNDNSICFAMELLDNAITLDRYLNTLDDNKLTSTIIDCIIQLCGMMWQLDNVLGINHRDLKPSNFLIIEHNEPVHRIIQVESEILEIYSKCSLVLIDFGFSCIGSTDNHVSNISLSTVYSKDDPCPKEGRDMFLFLGFLYIDYCHKLPDTLISLFEEWLNTNNSKLTHFMEKDEKHSKKWLYFIAGNEKITEFNCCPLKIIKDIEKYI
jgi:serine/threonine protein kinase